MVVMSQVTDATSLVLPRRGFDVTAQATQQVGADGMEDVVGAEVQCVDEGERRPWPVDLGHRDGAVEGETGLRSYASSWS